MPADNGCPCAGTPPSVSSFTELYSKPLRKKPRMGRSSLLVAMDLKGLFRRVGDSQFALSHLEPLSDSVLLARIVQGTVNYRGKFLKVRINLIEALKEDKSAIHNFVLFLIQVGVGMELDLRVILPLNRFKLVAFLLKEELHHFGMRSDADAS